MLLAAPWRAPCTRQHARLLLQQRLATTSSVLGRRSKTVVDELDPLGRLPGWQIPKGTNDIERSIQGAEHPFLLSTDLNTHRPGFYEPDRPWWSMWERVSRTPRRNRSALKNLSKYVNCHPSDSKDEYFFFPTRVEPGFKQFVPRLLEEHLSGWNGYADHPELARETTDAVLDRFAHAHLAYVSAGVVPLFTVVDKENTLTKTKMTLEDCWLTKGLFSSLEASSPVSSRDAFTISSVLFDGASVDRTMSEIISNRPNGQFIVGLQVGLNITLQADYFIAKNLPNHEELLKPENRKTLVEYMRSVSEADKKDRSIVAAQYTIPRKFIFRFDSHPFSHIVDRRYKLSDVDRQIECEVAEREQAIFLIRPEDVEI